MWVLSFSTVLQTYTNYMHSYIISVTYFHFLQICGRGRKTFTHWQCSFQIKTALQFHKIVALCITRKTWRWYPAKRALPAMLPRGRYSPFGRIPLIDEVTKEMVVSIPSFLWSWSYDSLHSNPEMTTIWPYPRQVNLVEMPCLTHWGRDKMTAIFQTTI